MGTGIARGREWEGDVGLSKLYAGPECTMRARFNQRHNSDVKVHLPRKASSAPIFLL